MFNVEAKIIQSLGEKTGISKQTGNPWVSREYLGEYMEGDKNIRFTFTVFGDQIAPLEVGSSYALYLKLEGKEWQGKWFNNVMATKVYASSRNEQQQNENREPMKPIEPKPDATLDKDGKLHTNQDADANDVPF